jgi:radical SAM/Cys-rich protein
MEACLQVLQSTAIPVVDITGGAPELNPHFRWFVEECRKLGKKILDRCNLTVILSNKKYHDLPDFFAKHEVEVVSSLPFYNADRTDRQRGEGVFEASVKAMRMLNDAGYAKEGSGLSLNLVYNPVGAFLSAGQQVLEGEFKRCLKKNSAFTSTSYMQSPTCPSAGFLNSLFAAAIMNRTWRNS